MSMRSLPNVTVQSEFFGYNGDCTEDAFDMAAHTAYPGQFPVTSDELDKLTTAAVAAGKTTSQNGAMTADDLAWLCSYSGVKYTQVDGGAWLTIIQSWAGIKPIIVQVLNGSALPGNQGGVNGHAVTIFGYDPVSGDVLVGNGDSTNGKAGRTDTFSVQFIGNAQPFAFTILEVEPAVFGPGSPGFDYFKVNTDGSWETANPSVLTGKPVQLRGLMQETYSAEVAPLASFGLPLTDEITVRLSTVDKTKMITVQVYERVVRIYDPFHELDAPPSAGRVYSVHLDRVHDLLGINTPPYLRNVDMVKVKSDVVALDAVQKSMMASLMVLHSDLGV